MGYWIVNGKQMTNEEYEELKRQEQEAKERVRREVAERVRRLGQEYESLTRLLQENPEVGRQVSDQEARDEEIYKKLQRSLQRADETPRCRWVKQDGRCCGSPQMRKHIYCFAHKQMMEARALMLKLPALEDANAIQIALMRVQAALIDHTISERAAGLLLYSLQIATINVEKTTFGQAENGELATDLVDEREALSEAAVESACPAVGQNQKSFTAVGAKEAGEEGDSSPIRTAETDNKGLTRIEPDEYGREGTEGTIPPHELMSGAPPAKWPRAYELHKVHAKLG